IEPTFSSLTEEQVQAIVSEVVKTDLELIAARATLDAMEAANLPSKEVHAQRIQIEALKNKREGQLKYLQLQKVEKIDNRDVLEARYLRQEITALLSAQETIKQNLRQLEFEKNREAYRVHLVDPAIAPKSATDNKQYKYMAAVPVVVFGALLAVFMVMTIR